MNDVYFILCFFFFFFQAEDGIRDLTVTGVQTCAFRSGKPGEWAYAESPLVDGDVVVVTPGGAEATMVALNKKTGALIWKSAVPGGDPAGYASAIVVQFGGRKQYVQCLSKGMVGVDAKTGQFLWRNKEVAKGPAQYFTPVASGEHVYGGALGVGGVLVRLTADGSEQVYLT